MKAKAGSIPAYALLAALLFIGFGCAGPGGGVDEHRILRKAPGHVFQLGEIKEKDMDTPSYLPTRIRFETEKLLREKGLLASGGASEKRLMVRITVEAVYPGYGDTWERKESYSSLDSRVEVLDAEKGDLVAESSIHAYGAWGYVTSDFTEMSHARDIVRFLESLVR